MCTLCFALYGRSHLAQLALTEIHAASLMECREWMSRFRRFMPWVRFAAFRRYFSGVLSMFLPFFASSHLDRRSSTSFRLRSLLCIDFVVSFLFLSSIFPPCLCPSLPQSMSQTQDSLRIRETLIQG
ncbi:hypothetical protein F5Y01DRAFT_281051 [Xylaria sp. FL0043]|nr:hypothetical protein F5Y01DRAFT_281051 [Xylaria sp. FL0043]